ncbi:hypothetical protein D3C80_1073630 [compost metagenome]
MARQARKDRRVEILADIERQRIEKAEARREALRLTNTGAEARIVEQLTQQEKGPPKRQFVVRARRVDVFQLLLEKAALAQDSFDAVRAYEYDVSVALGHTTPERRPDFIRGSDEGAPGQNISQAQVEASRRMQWVRDRLPPRDFRLLEHLLVSGSAAKGQWRRTVETITGERMDHAQTAAVRLMADNVRDVRNALFREGRRAA